MLAGQCGFFNTKEYWDFSGGNPHKTENFAPMGSKIFWDRVFKNSCFLVGHRYKNALLITPLYIQWSSSIRKSIYIYFLTVFTSQMQISAFDNSKEQKSSATEDFSEWELLIWKNYFITALYT